MRVSFNKIDWKKLREDKGLKLNIGLAVVLVIFFVFFLDIMFTASRFRHFKEERPKEVMLKEEGRKAEKKEPRKEKIASKEPVIRKKKIAREKRATIKGPAAMVAVILDDAGGKLPDYDEISSIKEPLTISVIPQLPDSSRIAKAMADAGFEVMLHLPMESVNENYTTSGSGMVTCSQSDSEIWKTVLDDLESVRWAVGLNNHMGSKATADERVMKNVLETMKGRDLYFIDSRTSDRSVAFKLARSLNIPSAENNIFLDSNPDRTYIEANFRRLISMARQKGEAIGIGHATRPATVSVLKQLMPEYEKEGVDFVYASELVK